MIMLEDDIARLRRKVRDTDLADFEIMDGDIKNPGMPIRGDTRMAMGLAYSDREWEEKREKILDTPLP